MISFNFLFFIVGFSLVTISFMMGKKNQEVINEKFDKISTSFFSKSSVYIIRKTALSSANIIENIYKNNIVITSFKVSLSMFLLLSLVIFNDIDSIRFLIFEALFNKYVLMSMVFIITINVLLDTISFLTTRYFLLKINESKSLLLTYKYLFLEILVGLLFFCIPASFLWVINFVKGEQVPSFFEINHFLFNLLYKFITTGNVPAHEQITLVFSLTAFFPTLLFITTLIIMYIILVLNIILPKPVNFLLKRLNESENQKSYLSSFGSTLILLAVLLNYFQL